MTDSKVSKSARMAAIASLAKEDILSLRDAEILAEVVEDGLEPAQEATKLRESALAQIRLAKRTRLEQARSSYDHATVVPIVSKQRPPLNEIKKVVQRIIQSGSAGELQLAFRKGQKLSDSDWEGLWDDMVEMGLIDDAKPEE